MNSSESAIGTRYPVGGDSFAFLGGVDGFSMIDYTGLAGVPGPPLHVHRGCDEAWYVLEGEVEFARGAERSRHRAGACVFIPRGTPHTFKVLRDARWVGIFSPGASWNLVRELGELLPAAGPPDATAIERLFARYATEILGPPL